MKSAERKQHGSVCVCVRVCVLGRDTHMGFSVVSTFSICQVPYYHHFTASFLNLYPQGNQSSHHSSHPPFKSLLLEDTLVLYIKRRLCTLSCFSHIQLFVTPWTVAHQAPLSMRFFLARIPEWVAISFSRRSS